MTKYVIKRLVLGVATVFTIMTMLFVLIKMLPNTVEPNLLKTDIALKQMYEAWGYNEPILTQYGIFLKNVFTDWNWGVCTTTGTYLMPVTEYIAGKLPYTMYLIPLSFPAVCASASSSPSPWRATPTFSSVTSLPPRST